MYLRTGLTTLSMSGKALLLSFALLLLCGSGVCAKDFNEKKVVLNLAVLSDTHVDGPNTVPAYKFRSALIQARDFAAAYGGLDGVLLAGLAFEFGFTVGFLSLLPRLDEVVPLGFEELPDFEGVSFFVVCEEVVLFFVVLCARFWAYASGATTVSSRTVVRASAYWMNRFMAIRI